MYLFSLISGIIPSIKKSTSKSKVASL